MLLALWSFLDQLYLLNIAKQIRYFKMLVISLWTPAFYLTCERLPVQSGQEELQGFQEAFSFKAVGGNG